MTHSGATEPGGYAGATHPVESGPVPLTAFERVGGAPAISSVVDQFYAFVLADERLGAFFASDSGGVAVTRVDMARQRGHFKALVGMLLGGPVGYAGRDLALAHRGLGVTSTDYERVSNLFIGTLWLHHVPVDIIDAVAEKLDAVKPLIVEAGAASLVAQR